jgi:hypothetical protein
VNGAASSLVGATSARSRSRSFSGLVRTGRSAGRYGSGRAPRGDVEDRRPSRTGPDEGHHGIHLRDVPRPWTDTAAADSDAHPGHRRRSRRGPVVVRRVGQRRVRRPGRRQRRARLLMVRFLRRAPVTRIRSPRPSRIAPSPPARPLRSSRTVAGGWHEASGRTLRPAARQAAVHRRRHQVDRTGRAGGDAHRRRRPVPGGGTAEAPGLGHQGPKTRSPVRLIVAHSSPRSMFLTSARQRAVSGTR